MLFELATKKLIQLFWVHEHIFTVEKKILFCESMRPFAML